MTLWAISLRIDSISFAFGECSYSIYDTVSVAQFESLFNIEIREAYQRIRINCD